MSRDNVSIFLAAYVCIQAVSKCVIGSDRVVVTKTQEEHVHEN